MTNIRRLRKALDGKLGERWEYVISEASSGRRNTFFLVEVYRPGCGRAVLMSESYDSLRNAMAALPELMDQADAIG